MAFARNLSYFLNGDVVVVAAVVPDTHPQLVVLHLIKSSNYGLFVLNITQKPVKLGKSYVFNDKTCSLTLTQATSSSNKESWMRKDIVSFKPLTKIFSEGERIKVVAIVPGTFPQQIVVHGLYSVSYEFVKLNIDQEPVELNEIYLIKRDDVLEKTSESGVQKRKDSIKKKAAPRKKK